MCVCVHRCSYICEQKLKPPRYSKVEHYNYIEHILLSLSLSLSLSVSVLKDEPSYSPRMGDIHICLVQVAETVRFAGEIPIATMIDQSTFFDEILMSFSMLESPPILRQDKSSCHFQISESGIFRNLGSPFHPMTWAITKIRPFDSRPILALEASQDPGVACKVTAWDSENVVVLMTSETLKRMWCAAEIASAWAAGTNIVLVSCDGDLLIKGMGRREKTLSLEAKELSRRDLFHVLAIEVINYG